MSNWPSPHHGMVSEYQASGVPFVTSSAANEVATSAIQVNFPFVTRWIQVFNTDPSGADTIRLGFTSNGVLSAPNANYLILSGGQATDRLELKCSAVWFRQHGANPTSFSLIAGLTNVPIKQFFTMSGSNGVAGVG
jgi:hypothetical protein